MDNSLFRALTGIYAKESAAHRDDLGYANHDESLAYVCPLCDHRLVEHDERDRYYNSLVRIFIALANPPYIRDPLNQYAFVCRCPQCSGVFWFHCDLDFYENVLELGAEI